MILGYYINRIIVTEFREEEVLGKLDSLLRYE